MHNTCINNAIANSVNDNDADTNADLLKVITAYLTLFMIKDQ